jgi:hypothetical protein
VLGEVAEIRVARDEPDVVIKAEGPIRDLSRQFADLGPLERHAFVTADGTAADVAAALLPRVAAGEFRLG